MEYITCSRSLWNSLHYSQRIIIITYNLSTLLCLTARLGRKVKQRRQWRQREGQKIGETTTLNVHHVFFLAVVARLLRETSYFLVLWRTWTQNNNFHFLSLNFDTILKKVRHYLSNWTRWNKRNKVWSGANSRLKWRFWISRRCLSFLILPRHVATYPRRHLAAHPHGRVAAQPRRRVAM